MQFNKNTSSSKKSIIGLVVKSIFGLIIVFGVGKSILFNKYIATMTNAKTKVILIANLKNLSRELVFFINCI